ncbi:MAG: DUF4340 domain-containing protein [Phycisphaerales bacterium]
MIKNRDILILLILAVVFVLLSVRFSTTDYTQKQTTNETLVSASSIHFDDVQKIELFRQGHKFIFENIEGNWKQTSPFDMQMDVISMHALIESVQGVQVLGKVLDPSSAPSLENSEGMEYISLSDGQDEVTIFLGRKTLGGRAYAQLKGAPVSLVDQSLHRRALEMDYRLWRDVRLFPNFAIDGILVERNVEGNQLIVARSDGKWSMLVPVVTRVDQEMFAVWVGRLAGARVGTYVLDEPEEYSMFGLDQAPASFTTTDRQGVSRTLLIGGRVSAGSSDRYVMLKGQPVVFRMKWDALSGLFPVPEMFIDATGSGVSKYDVKQVILRFENEELVFTRDLHRWIGKNGLQTNGDEVDALLTWILEAKPPSVALGEYPSADEVATVTMVGYDSLPLDTVRIALDPSGQWILENGDTVLRLHPAESGSAFTHFQKK